MPGHLEGPADGESGGARGASAEARLLPALDHIEEPEWTRQLIALAAQSLLVDEMPLAWLLGPDSAKAFCETGARPAPPFAAGSDGVTWVVSRADARVGSSDPSAMGPDPRPTAQSGLVTLWYEGSYRCLLDVLVARSLALDGPPIAVGFTLADLVAELASRRWSDLGEIYLVGFGRQVRGLDRVRFLAGAADAVALLRRVNEQDEHASRCFVVAPGISGATARLELIDLLAWAEHVAATTVICCDTSVKARCTWHLSSHGHTLRLEVRGRSGPAALLTPERWVERAAASERRPARLTLPTAARPLHDRPAVPRVQADRVHPVGRLGEPDDVEIDFLGPVRVIGAPGSFDRRRRLTELVVYIAFHPEGVTGDALAAALWPDRRVPLQTIANRLHEARQALGRTSDGTPRIQRINGRHRLSPDVRSDWARFRRLAPSESSPSQCREALSLVRGRPFAGLSGGEWVGFEGAASRVEADIVAVAERLGTHLLRTGDPAGAAWAARQGIIAAPWDERLYRLLMSAADASGNRGAVDSALRSLAQSLEWDGNPIEGVHPATAAHYRQLTGKQGVSDRAVAAKTGGGRHATSQLDRGRVR